MLIMQFKKYENKCSCSDTFFNCLCESIGQLFKLESIKVYLKNTGLS